MLQELQLQYDITGSAKLGTGKAQHRGVADKRRDALGGSGDVGFGWDRHGATLTLIITQ